MTGIEVVQETRRWNDDKEYSYAMPSKEDAQDYRYFPDMMIKIRDICIKKQQVWM